MGRQAEWTGESTREKKKRHEGINKDNSNYGEKKEKWTNGLKAIRERESQLKTMK